MAWKTLLPESDIKEQWKGQRQPLGRADFQPTLRYKLTGWKTLLYGTAVVSYNLTALSTNRC